MGGLTSLRIWILACAVGMTQVPSPRGVTISGRVVDGQSDRPIPDAGVRLVRRDTATVFASTRSELAGTFAFANVPNGRYELEAWKDGYIRGNLGQRDELDRGHVLAVGDAHLTNQRVPIWKQGTISGRLWDGLGRLLPGVNVHAFAETPIAGRLSWMHLFEAPTDESGAYSIGRLSRGRYLIVAGQGSPEPLAPAFFPSGSDPLSTVPIELATGEDRGGMDIRVPQRDVFVVRGRVAAAAAQLVQASVRLVQPYGDQRSYFVAGTARVKPDGSFIVPGVPSGDYLLEVYLPAGSEGPTWSADVEREGSGGSMPDSRTVSRGPQLVVPVAVRGDEVSLDPSLPTAALTIRGRLVLDPRSKGNVDRLPVTTLYAVSADGHAIAPATPGPDGQFTVSGLGANGYFLRFIGSPPAGWTVSDVTVGGKSAMEQPFILSSQDVGDAIVYLTDRLSELTGSVRGRSSASPDPHALVVAFPPEHRRWIDNGRNPPWIRNVRTDTNGNFTVRGLPPGEYLVVALPAGRVEWQTAEGLARLAKGASRVTILDAQRATITLTTLTDRR